MPKITVQTNQKGQVLVIMAVSLLVLLVFIGLAIDGTQLFLNYTRLKRAVDAASIAAANDFKKGATLDNMKSAAMEILDLHQVPNTANIQIYTCETANVATLAPEFYRLCPAPGALKKKLIFIRAYDNSPTFFVHLIGIGTIPLTTTAVAEAAPVDLVIVLDTSESMGNLSTGYNSGDFNPAACNAANNCRPLKDAKDAAKYLIDQLYPGYDRVAVVTFDTIAMTPFSFIGADGGDLTLAKSAIDNRVVLHDDPPANKLFASWYNAGTNGRYNPVNPEDRDNNGADDDPKNTPLADSTVCNITVLGGDRWDTSKNIPCDSKDYLDAFDWNQDTLFKYFTDPASPAACTANPLADDDHCLSLKWKQNHNPLGLSPLPPMSMVSTCSGCGMREATANLVSNGRSNAVWVIVFLSDGVANMSDTPATYPYDGTTSPPSGIPATYPNGFCGGKIDVNGSGSGINYWKTNCIKWDTGTRYCIDTWTDAAHNTCPSTNTTQTVVVLTNPANGYNPPYTPPYSADDYARDMTDAAALRSSLNVNEPVGNDIAIYSVGFGDAVAFNTGAGESLLRYMAAVGDDGNRETDPCRGIAAKHKCGQYYFAQNPSDLLPAFQDIATRIYTKISE